MSQLIDSNIIIYSYSEKYSYLRDIIISETAFVSEISRIEVLGYHKLTSDEERYFKDVFDFLPLVFPSQQIFNQALLVRKQYNLKLGDSIIAATALLNELTIYTRNIDDFKKVEGLTCINPIQVSP